MSEEVDSDHTDEIVCPYCGHRFTDSYEYEEGEVDCEDCGKEFVLTIHKYISYSSKRLEVP